MKPWEEDWSNTSNAKPWEEDWKKSKFVELPNGSRMEVSDDELQKLKRIPDYLEAWATERGLATAQDFHDPTEGMSGTEKFLAGAGQGMHQLAKGIGQTFGMVNQDKIKEQQAIDQSLNKSTVAKLGNFTGKVALTAPAAFIPGANSAVGAAAIGAGVGLAEPVAEGDVLQGKLKNAAVGATFGYGGNKLGKFAGDKIKTALQTRAAQRATQQALNTVQNESLKAGQKLGLRANPTQANPTLVNRFLEGWAGKQSTAQQLAGHNQKIVNNVAAKSLGLADDTPLTPEILGKVRSEAGKAYEAVKKIARPIVADNQYVDDLAKLGQADSLLAKEFPEIANKKLDKYIVSFLREKISPESAIETIKRLRSDAKIMFRSDKPAQIAKAKVSKGIADAIEGMVERNLKQTGDDVLYNNFVNARQLIAKTYSVEDALNVGSGNVLTRKLAAQLQKGKPLSGDIKDVAKFGSTFDRATQEIRSSMPGISPLDMGVAAISMAGAKDPSMLAKSMGLILGRPLVRSAITSGPYQKFMTNPSYVTPFYEQLAKILSSQPVQRQAANVSSNLAVN